MNTFNKAEIGTLFTRYNVPSTLYKKVKQETQNTTGKAEIVESLIHPNRIGDVLTINRSATIKTYEECPFKFTYGDRLCAAAHRRDENLIQLYRDAILIAEQQEGGTIVNAVKDACKVNSIPYERIKLEHQFSTNLIFKIGDTRIIFRYSGGAMAKVACGPVQMMALFEAFFNNLPNKTRRGLRKKT